MSQHKDRLRRLLIEFDNFPAKTDEEQLKRFQITEQAILSEYISKKDVLEAIGPDEPDEVIEQYSDGTRAVRINPTNKLRTEIKQKLNIGEYNGKEKRG